jgi:FkbM family methyltransferase
MTFYSQYKQDEILNETFFKNFKDGVFVDVGAHDGISLNNTLYFENEHNWTGINIEPIPHVFEKCKINRPNCINVCCAIDREEGCKKFRVNSGYTEMLSGLVDHLCDKHIQRTELENIQHQSTSEFIFVPTKPLHDIFKEHNLTKINLLSVDVEGAEQAVIESIDFKNVSIDVILFENNYPENSTPIVEYLENLGFMQYQCNISDIFMIHRESDFLKK